PPHRVLRENREQSQGAGLDRTVAGTACDPVARLRAPGRRLPLPALFDHDCLPSVAGLCVAEMAGAGLGCQAGTGVPRWAGEPQEAARTIPAARTRTAPIATAR